MGNTSSRKAAKEAAPAAPVELDPAMRASWHARSEATRQHIFAMCLKSDQYPHKGGVMEIVDQADAPYAQDFMGHFRRYSMEHEYNQSILGQAYSERVEVHEGTATPLGENGEHMLYIPYTCHPPEAATTAGDNPYSAAWYGMAAKHMVQRTIPEGWEYFYEGLVYPLRQMSIYEDYEPVPNADPFRVKPGAMKSAK